MATKHYYAMLTPDGDAVNAQGKPIGTVLIFDRKHERNAWVEANAYDKRTGNTHQTKAITEHEARITMLRQHGREMFAWHNGQSAIAYDTYREYAQYHPTALMVADYDKVAYIDRR